jgi:hypothetical protein
MIVELVNAGLTFGQLVAGSNPVAGLVIEGVKEIVKKSNDGIGDDSVIAVLKEMGHSSWNSLNADKIERIIKIIKE